jgi:O-acetyl-ADP-ribose deacetylase (regulator of RNase III)
MVIKHIKGNLLDFPSGINIIVHSCNTKNVFGAGIAKSIKDEYPAAYEADTLASSKGENKLGYMSYANVSGGKKVVNLYTQAGFGAETRQVDYEAFYIAISRLRDALEQAHKEGRKYVLGFPYKISCGLAGGDWEIIQTMIEQVFEPSSIETFIVNYNK